MRIIIRTIFKDCFTVQLYNMLKFDRFYDLYLISNGKPTDLQRTIMNVLKKKGWNIHIIRDISHDESWYALLRLVKKKKLNNFFTFDDDVIFEEKHLFCLQKYVQKNEVRAGCWVNKIFDEYSFEVNNDKVIPLLDTRAMFFTDLDPIKLKDFEDLNKKGNSGRIWIEFMCRLVSKMKGKYVYLYSKNPPIHIPFKYKEAKWKYGKGLFNNVWKTEKIIKKCMNKYKLYNYWIKVNSDEN